MKKQNLLKLSLLALILSLATIRPASTFAATTNVTGGTNGPLCNSGGYFTPSSVTITSGDTITFSVPSNDPYAGGVQVNGFPQGSFVVPRGGSITTQALTANVSYKGTWPGAPSCIKGSGTITVQAPTAPSTPPTTTTTPTTTSNSTPSTSTSSASSTKATATPTKTTPSTTTTPATQIPTSPETVVADTITVAGNKVTPAEGQGLTINRSQPLALSGTTVPNGKITLTIHSNPITATVQANSSGNWSYTVTGLQPGNHTIYATVTDPANNQTSTQSKLLAFTIAATPVASVTHASTATTKKSTSLLIPSIFAVVTLLILGAVGLLVTKNRKSRKAASSIVSPADQPSTDTLQTQAVKPQVPANFTTPQENVQQSVTSGEHPVEEQKDNTV
jgi:hypothetical protein